MSTVDVTKCLQSQGGTQTLHINGQYRVVTSELDTPLLWILRADLALTGTKYGCGMAECGACTVHIESVASSRDWVPVRACVTPLSAVGSREVKTIECLDGPEARALFEAWTEVEVVQCGYCQPGQLMSAAALLMRVPAPADKDIDEAMSGNLCRCGTYPRIRAAIKAAAKKLAAGR